MRIPDPKANTTTEAYLAYKAGYLEESELKPVLYEPYLHFDAWLAYWAGLTYGYPLKEVGKNLFSSPIVIGGWAANGAALNSNKRFKSKNKISVSSGSSYIISGSPKDDTKTLNITVQAYASDGSVIRQFPSSSTWGDAPLSFTAPNGCAYITISGRYSDDTELGALGQETDVFQNAQLEVGSTATAYEPYTGEPEMLCDEEALVAYLSGVTDTYPVEIKDPYDVRIVGYLRHLASIRWPEPDYPVNNEEFYLSTMEPPHTSNPEPSSDIELDTAEGKIISVEAYGDTYQQTYNGQNLFDMSVDNRVAWSDALTEDENGWITATGYNGFYNFWTKPNMNLVPGATYYYVLEVKEVYAANASDHIMICNGAATASASKPQFVDDADLKYADLQAGGIYVGSITASSDFSTANNMLRSWCRPYNESSKIVFRLTIMSSQPNPSTFVYEPYVGGIPAPNPDYPQDIQVVTGEQIVTVTGKNLYNLTSGPTTESGVTGIGTTEYFTMDGAVSGIGGRLVFNECTLPAGTYTATTYCDSGEIVGNVNFCIYKKNTWSQVTNFTAMKFFPSEIGTSKTTTFTLSEETSLWFSAYLNTNASFENLKGRFQLERGSTDTAYEPYQSQSYTISLGSLELCKIGDYQDYIYKSDDDWYVHKATNKFIVTSALSLGKSGTSSNNAYYYSAGFQDIDTTNMGSGNSSATVTPSFSTYFGAISAKDIFNLGSIGMAFDKGSGDIIDFRVGFGLNSVVNTLELFKSWLDANELKVYYPLATPTDTQITDATLVGQLDALAGADTYNEKTFIKVTATDPNLPALLKVEAYKY